MFIPESADALNASPLIFPALECFHITGFAILVGTISILDFRLLGIGMTKQSPAELYGDVAPWTLAGLVLVALSGIMLYSSDPDMYYLNWAFLIKMGFLTLALLFHYTLHRQVIRAGAPPGFSKLIACTSLFLWTGVVFGGIAIGFVTEGL